MIQEGLYLHGYMGLVWKYVFGKKKTQTKQDGERREEHARVRGRGGGSVNESHNLLLGWCGARSGVVGVCLTCDSKKTQPSWERTKTYYNELKPPAGVVGWENLAGATRKPAAVFTPPLWHCLLSFDVLRSQKKPPPPVRRSKTQEVCSRP